jgi:hypothetical protein
MKNTSVLKENDYLFSPLQAGNEPTSLTALQTFLAPYAGVIEAALWILWCAVLVYVIYRLLTLPNNNSEVGSQ